VTRLPIIDCRQMEKLLLKLGFQSVRRKGGHVFYRHSDGRTTTVPHHPGRELARPLIRQILREIDVSPEQYVQVLAGL
jgi:predicted RNA binding protein YcfA (HicA-like mRNA interferase family)